jgi:hypothetical protein
MGTNYYLHDRPDCECCGRPFPAKHIGKSSGGWCFSLHVDPDERINGLSDWEALWSVPGALIRDEYGTRISVEEMRRIILERSHPRGGLPGPDWLQQNSASPGPNGLVRHKLDGRHCVGHGDGTYDLITGEFS